MKYLLLLVFLSVIASGYGLKCYTCSGTGETCEKANLDKDEDKYVMTCDDNVFDKCMRIWSKKDDTVTIANSCTNEDGCTESEKACDEFDGKCAVGCCDSDKCNASSTLSFSVILMAACSVFGLALLK